MVKHGHVDKVLEVWNEWCQSTIGRRDNTLHSEVFCGGVISALAMNGRADDAEKVFNTRSLADKTNEIMLLSLLTAFSHAGLHKRAISLLNRVEKNKFCQFEFTMQSLMLVHVLVSLILLLKLLIE